MIDFQKISQLQSQRRLEQEKETETLLSTFTEEIGSQPEQNFSQDDKDVPKKKKKRRKSVKSNYSNIKVKARNILSNTSYGRFKQEDFLNSSFIIDILSFIVQYFSPINLNRKLDNEKARLMVKFM